MEICNLIINEKFIYSRLRIKIDSRRILEKSRGYS